LEKVKLLRIFPEDIDDSSTTTDDITLHIELGEASDDQTPPNKIGILLWTL
jgi:hypothetical protein